jgi:hypothetical protein
VRKIDEIINLKKWQESGQNCGGSELPENHSIQNRMIK